MDNLGQILIADDEETFLQATADLLRRDGYACDCARDATTASQMLRQGDYDLLIADIRMPGNLELQLIKDIPSIAEGLPVILVTGFPSLNSAIESIQLPVAAYFIKPINFDHLLEQVRVSIPNFRAYRSVKNIRKRLQDCREDLKAVEDRLVTTPGQDTSGSVNDFLSLTFQNIIGSLSDVRHLAETLASQTPQQDACHLLNCPRQIVLTSAIKETIKVLEKTKGSFKSKELAELRKKLEVLTENE